MKRIDELTNIAPATRRALARRALSAARRVEAWLKFLEDELEKQGGGRLGSAEEHAMPFTLKRRDAVHLMAEMGGVVAGIRELIRK
jgi:hypothetical protein